MDSSIDRVFDRYSTCATEIWRMFEKDPLPADEPAHTMLERLEALVRRKLIGPTPNPVPACSHGLVLADGACAKCHASIDPAAVAAARTKGAFQSAGSAPEVARCAEGHPTRWLKRCDVLDLVNAGMADVLSTFADDADVVARGRKLLDGLRALPVFPTRRDYARTCTTCGRPFGSADSDPRCSACVEAGDAQGHAPVPRTVVIDQRWHDGVKAARQIVQEKRSTHHEQEFFRQWLLDAIDALPRPTDLGATPKSLLASLGQAIDGVEQSAIDANRRAGHNAKERDEADATGYARGRCHIRDDIVEELRLRAGRADRDSDAEREIWLLAASAAEMVR